MATAPPSPDRSTPGEGGPRAGRLGGFGLGARGVVLGMCLGLISAPRAEGAMAIDGAGVRAPTDSQQSPPAAPQLELARRVAQFESDWIAARAALPEGQALDLSPFVERMEALVAAGHAQGHLWLLDHLEARRLPQSEQRSSALRYLRGAFGAGLASSSDRERALLHLATWVAVVERAEAQPWAYAGLDPGTPDAVRAASLWALAELASAGGTSSAAADLKEADELLTRLLSGYPNSAAAAPARLRLCGVLSLRYEAERELWWQQWTASSAPPDPAQHPARQWWPRFEELANAEVGPALWWMVVNADHSDLEPDQRRARRLAWMERILEFHAEADWLVPAIQESARMVDELSLAAVIELGERLLAKSQNEEVRAWALFTLAGLAARQPDGRPRAIELLERLGRELPRHRLSAGIGPRIFALRCLQVGQVAPDVEVVLPGEAPVRLSDYRGRALALVFWSYFSGGFVTRLGALQTLADRYPSEEFLLLGVNLDSNIQVARERALAEGLKGQHLWLGEPNAAWPRTWDLHSFPAVFVLDAEGVIRGRDLSAAQAVELIETLLAPPAESFQSTAKNTDLR